MTLTIEIVENAKKLGREIKPIAELKDKMTKFQQLKAQAFNFGYEDMEYGTLYEDGSQGLLVKMGDGHNKYNNGVYLLKLTPSGLTQLEVIVPNTANKGALVRMLTSDTVNFIQGLDLADFEPYDYMELLTNVIDQVLIKPLSEQLIKDPLQQVAFQSMYMTRLVGDMALYYTAKERVDEETVNVAPFIIKQLLSQKGTAK